MATNSHYNHVSHNDTIPSPTHETQIIDGVLRWPPTGLRVVIVGGGPAGLLAALECWRKGHQVEVVERNQAISTIGDIFFVGPSALATLKDYPTMLQQYSNVSWDNYVTYRRSDGMLVAPPFEWEYNRDDVPHHAAWPLRIRTSVSRAGLSEILYQQCRRLNIPVTFGVTVVDFEESASQGSGTAIATDGRRFTADIVIAADGLGTKSHKVVTGEVIRANPTGFAICRNFYRLDPEKHAALREKLAELSRPDCRCSSGEGFHCISVLSNDSAFVGITIPDDGTARESWAESITNEEFIKLLPITGNCDPLVLEIIRNIPENSTTKWQLCWRDPQPKWTSPEGRIIQLGDSAHAFIPSSMSGATTALEDGQSLAECLRLAGKEHAHLATKAHELMRLRRVSILQRVGFSNRREMHQKDGFEGIAKNKLDGGSMTLGKWTWTHNAEKYAVENFAKARQCLETGSEFEHTNIPKGFKWEDWSMKHELEKDEKGLSTADLKLNGDWGIY
ncbi:FAD binding domain protein [Colletotrichum tofieldiae]|nr:FAD binding domain protein [Colletotrichum tofieldiae]